MKKILLYIFLLPVFLFCLKGNCQQEFRKLKIENNTSYRLYFQVLTEDLGSSFPMLISPSSTSFYMLPPYTSVTYENSADPGVAFESTTSNPYLADWIVWTTPSTSSVISSATAQATYAKTQRWGSIKYQVNTSSGHVGPYNGGLLYEHDWWNGGTTLFEANWDEGGGLPDGNGNIIYTDTATFTEN